MNIYKEVMCLVMSREQEGMSREETLSQFLDFKYKPETDVDLIYLLDACAETLFSANPHITKSAVGEALKLVENFLFERHLQESLKSVAKILGADLIDGDNNKGS
ncbi:MAG: hypothetical protein LBQ52_04840 [Helicobacteraceae bacterium]|jgi:hypothetical protein|nr:hypothetical protein [Helicobacteraceae bacterium]